VEAGRRYARQVALSAPRRSTGMSIVGLVAWLVAASVSSHSPHNLAELSPARNCSRLPTDEQKFTGSITIFLDIHGSVGEPYKCREIAFTLDFSQVDLTRDHRDLLKQMDISTVLTLQPIDLRVRGYFSAARQRPPGVDGDTYLQLAGIPSAAAICHNRLNCGDSALIESACDLGLTRWSGNEWTVTAILIPASVVGIA
jgi:hypothetical protein